MIRGFLYGGNMKRQIYCPECASEIYNYDGSSTMEVVVKCKRCKNYIKFKPLGMATIVINKPEVKSSSGARFW